MKNLTPATFAISLVLVAGLSFFAGTRYQQSKATSNFRGNNTQQIGMNGQGRNQTQNSQTQNGNGKTTGRMQGGPQQDMGEITSMDDKSITVKLMDGSSKIIILSDKTTYSQEAEASKSALKVGTSVAVFGTDNTDGSVTATSINLNPSFRNRVSPTPAQ